MSLSRDPQQWIIISVSALNYVYFQQTRLVPQCYRDPAEVRTVTSRNQSFPVKVVTLYSPGDFEIVIQSSCWTWTESVGGKKWIQSLHLVVSRKQSCCYFFYHAHRNSVPQSRFICPVLCMHPSCLCCLYLLIGFLFCITRTNLIRAKGIQISAHPPKCYPLP